jgi:hypothetical protein
MTLKDSYCSYSKFLRANRVAQTGNLVISSGFLIIWMDEREADSLSPFNSMEDDSVHGGKNLLTQRDIGDPQSPSEAP